MTSTVDIDTDTNTGSNAPPPTADAKDDVRADKGETAYKDLFADLLGDQEGDGLSLDLFIPLVCFAFTYPRTGMWTDGLTELVFVPHFVMAVMVRLVDIVAKLASVMAAFEFYWLSIELLFMIAGWIPWLGAGVDWASDRLDVYLEAKVPRLVVSEYGGYVKTVTPVMLSPAVGAVVLVGSKARNASGDVV
ncbi:hypothetical protein Dda_3047 [Drechslerella dactyloides]|uniref:Uncharacterized protein n=1 Tax=Drechslerella dactyloides TaxID=74499 RepID=A0AAD6J533_DREDA|nr:hypothetical protein Dda_3047 [Drechslerella dactyloides]